MPLFDGQLMNFFISKMGHSRPLFLYFCIFYLNDQFEDKVCQCWDSNRGSLVSEASPPPTEPPPLPYFDLFYIIWIQQEPFCCSSSKFPNSKLISMFNRWRCKDFPTTLCPGWNSNSRQLHQDPGSFEGCSTNCATKLQQHYRYLVTGRPFYGDRLSFVERKPLG